ncbi:MAG TPA: DUF3237 family protein [Polyangiaceae bacterium]|nr:DUF3237 family protein [Polyangiaceae bacterium]
MSEFCRFPVPQKLEIAVYDVSVVEPAATTVQLSDPTGGTVIGRVTGSVVNAGADYQIVSGGATLDARYVLASNDGEFVIVRNCGPGGALVPLFETRAAGPYAFLNENTYLSSDPGVGYGGVSITFYELR